MANPVVRSGRLFGLIGYPLSHSFSKKYFSEKFEQEGITDCQYELFPLTAIDELPALLAAYPQLCGLNVTIPYKEQVISFLHSQNPLVAAIGACNCIRIETGQLQGFNTDAIGFQRSLQEKLLPAHRQALVFGTGGAAKAVCYVLRQLNIDYQLVSRRKMYDQLSYEEVTEALLQTHTLLINTTPLGMYPNVTEAPPLPYQALTADHYLYDLVYNPEQTLFLEKGAAAGARTKNGMDMLVIQAEESWKIWNS